MNKHISSDFFKKIYKIVVTIERYINNNNNNNKNKNNNTIL